MIQFMVDFEGHFSTKQEATHDWDDQYTKRKVPQGIVWYQAVMPQGIAHP